MFFKKNKRSIIQCPNCEWKPDGGVYWACDCGHQWNTFETKGKCPACQKQWTETYCPGCSQMPLEKDWYWTKEMVQEHINAQDPELRARKIRVESRLIGYRIPNLRIAHLPYLDFSSETFQPPREAGCRMVILNTMAYLVANPGEKEKAQYWFKDQKIQDKVSPKEMDFIESPHPPHYLLSEMVWRTESALTLGWCLGLVDDLPRLDQDGDQKLLNAFLERIPGIGEGLSQFLFSLRYRDMAEIFEENIFNELATSYFRDLLYTEAVDHSGINRFRSFERHQVLNWLRTTYPDMPGAIGEMWDEVDTST